MRLKNFILLASFLVISGALSFSKTQILVSPSHPERVDDEISKKARQYGITFPIPELGNCSSYLDCRNYCEDPVNFDTCISFAKKKGFYQGESEQEIRNVLKKAKDVLGCDSGSSCRNFCEKEENFDRCARFAEDSGLSGGYTHDPRSQEFLEDAKEFLGCSSYETCRNFCENPDNRDKCGEFARKIGWSGGYEYKGPGGCTSEETCRAFCSDSSNFEICKEFSEGQGGEFEGPGGCKDESSCRSYCEKNPSQCEHISEIARDYDPEEMCEKTPSCRWEKATCQCGFYEGDKEYDSAVTLYPTYRESYTPYPTKIYDPATECAKSQGCSWTGSYCQCSGSSGSSGSYTPYPTSGSSQSYDPASECTKTPGCSWTGSSCQCSSFGEPTGSYQSTPAPGGEVHGASTVTSLLQSFLQKAIQLIFGK